MFITTLMTKEYHFNIL